MDDRVAGWTGAGGVSGAGQVHGGREEQSRARESPPRSSQTHPSIDRWGTARTTGSEGQTMPPVRTGPTGCVVGHSLRRGNGTAVQCRGKATQAWLVMIHF